MFAAKCGLCLSHSWHVFRMLGKIKELEDFRRVVLSCKRSLSIFSTLDEDNLTRLLPCLWCEHIVRQYEVVTGFPSVLMPRSLGIISAGCLPVSTGSGSGRFGPQAKPWKERTFVTHVFTISTERNLQGLDAGNRNLYSPGRR